jgi:hypothetical protein
MISIFQQIPQITSIYIYSKNNKKANDQFIEHIQKIKGTFTDTINICKLLKTATVQCEKNLASISFIEPNTIKSTQNLNKLDSSFMYTQIMKEILLTIQFTDEHIHEFTNYCCKQSIGNARQLENIDHFENTYRHHVPIWWYSNQSFIYLVLNQALHNMEVDIIINMGFFLRDLHENNASSSSSFVVYRGQGLSKAVFDRLLKTQGGLMSFNNFLSTSTQQSVSLIFAVSILDDPELIGILFEITVHPLISSTVFADIREFSQFQEEEILFSMHSIL